MSNLIVEIGNTAVKAAWSDRVTLGKTFRYQGEKYKEFILSLLRKEKAAVLLQTSQLREQLRQLLREPHSQLHREQLRQLRHLLQAATDSLSSLTRR